jgi:glutamyl-tRNA reductase
VTHLLLLGVSHHTAPVELRERVDFVRQGVDAALGALTSTTPAGEAVIVSTCNRAEVYVTCADVEQTRRSLVDFLCSHHGVEEAQIEPHLYTRMDADVARHLFRVAAGLDSLVVGEPQILGQVKEAYQVASDQDCTGPLLNRLFHMAFGAGKRVRAETGLGEGAVSVGYAAVTLARKIFGRLDTLNVLVLGAGEMGKLTAKHLSAQNVRQMTIASRTAAHAEALAAEVQGRAVPWSAMDEALAASDIIVTATGAKEPVLTRAQLHGVMRARRNRALFVIDIALPRDVEAEAGDLEQLFLYNIDDLRAIVNENLARRATQIERAESLVNEDVGQFLTWMRSRDAIPTVVALRQRFETIRRTELARLDPKIATLPPDARNRIDEITRLIVEKLLLTPTEQLKAIDDEDTAHAYTDALSRLFRLASEPRDGPDTSDDAARGSGGRHTAGVPAGGQKKPS